MEHSCDLCVLNREADDVANHRISAYAFRTKGMRWCAKCSRMHHGSVLMARETNMHLWNKTEVRAWGRDKRRWKGAVTEIEQNLTYRVLEEEGDCRLLKQETAEEEERARQFFKSRKAEATLDEQRDMDADAIQEVEDIFARK